MARRNVAKQVSVALVSEKVKPEDNMALELLTPTETGAAVTVAVENTSDITDETQAITQFGTNKSAQIRYLHSKGYKNSPIAKFLSVIYGKEVKYQQVRNVLVQSASSKD